MDSRTVIQILTQDGWCEVRSKGSHRIFQHPTKPGTVVVPHPKKDLPIGTLMSIWRQAGLEKPRKK